MQLAQRIFRSSLFRSLTVYGTTNALNKAIPFLLIPIFTRYLSPFDYGIISMFSVLTSIFIALNGLGTVSAISLKYYHRDTVSLDVYIGNCILVLTASSIVLAVLLIPLSSPIERLTGIPHMWNWAALAISVANFFSTAMLYIWQASVRPVRYGTFQITQTTLNIMLSLWFIVLLTMGWKGRLYAQLITSAAFAVLAILFLRSEGWIRFQFNKEYIRNALKIGLPLLPHVLGGFIIDTTDRILITSMIGIEDTGIYTVGSQVGMIILFITGSFNMAWVPWLFGRLKSADASSKRRIVRITYGYSVSIIVLSLLLSATAPWLFQVFVGKAFSSGSRYVIWLALGYAFNGIYMMASNYLFYVEKTHLVAISTGIAATINVVSSYVLIHRFGTIGAAQGSMIAHLCTLIFTWYIASRVYPMPWRLSKG